MLNAISKTSKWPILGQQNKNPCLGIFLVNKCRVLVFLSVVIASASWRSRKIIKPKKLDCCGCNTPLAMTKKKTRFVTPSKGMFCHSCEGRNRGYTVSLFFQYSIFFDKSSAKSIQSGFIVSIKRYFHARFHFFNCFSRAIALSIY